MKNNLQATRLSLFTLALSALAACASPQSNYIPQVSYLSIPPLNTVNQVGLGEFMIQHLLNCT